MRTATPATYWEPKMSTIMALSISQPWAWLIVHQAEYSPPKDVENRDWLTKYRGPVLIHAPKKLDSDIVNVMSSHYVFGGLPPHWEEAWELAPGRNGYPLGGFVGIAQLTDVVTESESPWFVGKYGFVLRDARPLPFVSYKGSLGLFSVAVSSLRFMTPDGPGAVEDYDGSSPFMEQLERGKVAIRLDVSVHPSGRVVEYYEINQLSEVQQ